MERVGAMIGRIKRALYASCCVRGNAFVYDVVAEEGAHACIAGPDGEGNMGRSILYIVIALILGTFVYMGYTRYDAKRAGANGDVFSSDSSMGKSKGDAVPLSGSANSNPPAGQTPAPAIETTPVTPDATTQVGSAVGAPAASGGDTISPNPPNGMVFSGTGRYQLYRQGNLTWRVNTDSGKSCVLFATDDEWKKPKVYRAGCGSR
jgi:hypothetical protein